MKLRKKFTGIIQASSLILVFSFFLACNSPKNLSRDYLYFQSGMDSITNIQTRENVIQVNDILAIQITSKTTNQEQVKLFNTTADITGNGTGYLVNNSGNIEFPIIGSVKAAGLTKVQLQSLLTEKLTPYVKDPSVIIKYNQFKVNVLGEVGSPGTKVFTTDRVTIVDLIAQAGDLAQGERDNVMVIREENGKRNVYRVDLRSGSLFQSPVYLMQPNDIVYVTPNKYKLKELNTDPRRRENQRYYVTFISAISSLLSLYLVIRRI